MPFEEFVLAMTAIFSGAVVLIARSVVSFHRAKLQNQSRRGSGDEMTAGELQRLVRAAVEESIEPLAEKIDRLESQRVPRALEAPESSRVLEEFDEPLATEPTGRRRRIH